jgi:hypothetical protein
MVEILDLAAPYSNPLIDEEPPSTLPRSVMPPVHPRSFGPTPS